jgi:hypothetical protein
MRADLYTRVLLTIIAAALVYLCAALTPLPALRAQVTQRPGEFTGPTEVVIVGWRAFPDQPIPVEIAGDNAVPVEVRGDVRVVGRVETQQVTGRSDRVVLVGWEQRDTAQQPREQPFIAGQAGLPVSTGSR